MFTQTIRNMVSAIAPNLERRLLEARWLRQHSIEFKSGLLNERTIEGRVDFARAQEAFRSNQKRSEIIALLQELESLKPKRLCEIGADKGGTLALFATVAAPDAQLLSLDIHYPDTRAAAYQLLKTRRQKVKCIEADSHSHKTLALVRQWLKSEPLDFLFIDGDHSYDGVKADYEMYSPLVRPGGIIAFHDIAPDFWTRFGTKTGSNVGEVPRYWTELKQTDCDWHEFIEDPEQDGYGIGMIRAGKS